MTPLEAISALDRQIAQHGQPLTLRRKPAGDARSPYELTLRGFVRGYKAEEMSLGVVQGDRLAILSPTDLDVTAWLGSLAVQPGENPDRRVAMKGDKLVIADRQCNIEAAEGVYLDGQLVRVKLQVRG